MKQICYYGVKDDAEWGQETGWNAKGANFTYLKVPNERRKPSLMITNGRGKINMAVFKEAYT